MDSEHRAKATDLARHPDRRGTETPAGSAEAEPLFELIEQRLRLHDWPAPARCRAVPPAVDMIVLRDVFRGPDAHRPYA